MKQRHDSSGDCKFSLTANETLGQKTAMFLLSLPDFIINACDRVVIPANSGKMMFPHPAVKIYHV